MPPATEPLERAPEGTPLYVHLPFCAAKCPYCDFFSVPAEGQDVPGMVEAILREAQTRAPCRPATVFLGGGTPSLLSRAELTRLLDGLQELTGFRDSASEVSAECNPESLDEDKARALLELGVNRLSIGVQSLDAPTLELFGRVHSVDDSFHAYDAARRAGVENLNVDLIYAAPGQTPEAWEAELERVLALGPDHLSAYNLTFEEDTLFRRWLDQGRIEKSPEEVELACLEIARERTAAAGLAAYEISNCARPGRECRHNLGYWHNRPYVGLGPSAVSKVGHSRAGNARGIATYLRRIARDGHATQWSETLPAAQRLAETWWLGLRLARGVDPVEARRTAGIGRGPDPALAVAQKMASRDLLEPDEGRWRLTPLGLPVADAVAAEFLRQVPERARNPLPGRAAAGAGTVE